MSKCRYNLSEDCNNTDCLNCILDKIKADVVNIADGRRLIPVRSVIKILDKYKVENEG